MDLVDASCPNCGATIQLDKNREEGFCSYCGTKIIVQEAISKVRIDKSCDIQNLLQLAESAYNSENYEECLKYANKALEFDSNNSTAWILKMKAVNFLGCISNQLRISEFQEAGLKAVASANGNEKLINDVYEIFLIKAKTSIQFCDKQIRDVDNVKQYYNSMLTLDFSHANEKTSDFDESLICDINSIASKSVDLKNCVPSEFYTTHQEYQKVVVDMATAYVSYSEGHNNRLNIYGMKLSDEAVKARKEIFELIKKGLPEELFNNIDTSRINNNEKSGCYVATAVYGSYDCPEVWTLRRYRDFTLDKTWYGRLFIRVYYATSPTFVKFFGNRHSFKAIGKNILDKMVSKLNSNGYKNTPYKDKY